MEADLITDTRVIVRTLVFFSSHTHCHSNFLIKSDEILQILYKPPPSQCGGLNRPLSSSLETDNDRVKWHNQTLMYRKVVSFQRFPHIEQNFIIMTLLHDHIFVGCGLNSTRKFSSCRGLLGFGNSCKQFVFLVVNWLFYIVILTIKNYKH